MGAPQEQPLGPVQAPQDPAFPLAQVLHSQVSAHWQLGPESIVEGSASFATNIMRTLQVQWRSVISMILAVLHTRAEGKQSALTSWT